MSLKDFFSPLDFDKLSPSNGFYTTQLGNLVAVYTKDFPDLESGDFEVAIFGGERRQTCAQQSGLCIGSGLYP